MKIKVDTREQQPWQFAWADALEITTKKLDTGDYSLVGLEDVICIERKKTVSELASNLVKDRFTRELERMVEFQYSYLLLEFDYNHIENYPNGCGLPKKVRDKIKIRGPFIMGCLAKIQVDYNIHVIPCGHRAYAEEVAYNIFKRIEKLNKGK